MGKTYRRRKENNPGFWASSTTRGIVDENISDNIFHSDKPKRYSCIDSEVKQRQNEISRAEKRRAKHEAISEEDVIYDMTHKTSKRKANKYWQFS